MGRRRKGLSRTPEATLQQFLGMWVYRVAAPYASIVAEGQTSAAANGSGNRYTENFGALGDGAAG
jgi:hypothetical protein